MKSNSSNIICFLLLVFFTSLSFCSNTDTIVKKLYSPDGNLIINIDNNEKELTYSLNANGQTLISKSSISLFQNSKVEILKTEQVKINTTWTPVWGQFSEIQNYYNELKVTLLHNKTPYKLFIRAYNNGAAFRYEIDQIPKNSTPSFYIEYDLPKESVFYTHAGETKPKGPIALSTLSDSISNQKLFMPLMVENKEKPFIALLESDLASAPGFKVIDFNFDKERNKLIAKNDYNLKSNSLITPWRLILFEKNIGDLVTNMVPLNVAAPNKISDPSWIKPGKTLWDWRVHGYVAEDGFTYGIDNESYYRFIDFAAKNNIEYFLIDDSWYTDVKKGHIEMSEKLDLQKVSDYAKKKGVKLILYYDRHKGVYGDEELFPFYSSLGMSGVKYGFMGKNVSFSREAIRLSANSKLLIDFHDNPVPFTGMTRTYPNAVAREYCHAQQDSRRAFTPEAFIRMALINAIQGPLDMNNGIFDISGVNSGKREKGPKKLNSLITTVTAEAARTLIIFSGLVCIPDAPEAYTAKLDLFEFIQKMPVGKWDESKVLHAKMDEYISTARRHKKEWFIGSVHSKGGSLDINFDFLKEGKTYAITYYEDTDETDSKTNPEAYQIRKGTVKKGDIVKAKMVKGGGHCMWIRPE
ncbi:glycoside hydrolase family 97 catalytic domain-containing protein [Aureibaculum sp. A20]|uniref:Glycoside hydrolase family 97 catalytic domain-containing protein n=1 Tax=Aureibaculum flavum TaxID=2795986 RepID=A0ABS0WVH7_9FLAO|nr:glycoside hydrolase family 97 protein [Aureibaculum flavum]MBJ2175970.1 glycoside hydrolase family 97 catalytic domain-containing protein [Aureibaculum flavum]